MKRSDSNIEFFKASVFSLVFSDNFLLVNICENIENKSGVVFDDLSDDIKNTLLIRDLEGLELKMKSFKTINIL